LSGTEKDVDEFGDTHMSAARAPTIAAPEPLNVSVEFARSSYAVQPIFARQGVQRVERGGEL
jgi:hypothetical protein